MCSGHLGSTERNMTSMKGILSNSLKLRVQLNWLLVMLSYKGVKGPFPLSSLLSFIFFSLVVLLQLEMIVKGKASLMWPEIMGNSLLFHGLLKLNRNLPPSVVKMALLVGCAALFVKMATSSSVILHLSLPKSTPSPQPYTRYSVCSPMCFFRYFSPLELLSF